MSCSNIFHSQAVPQVSCPFGTYPISCLDLLGEEQDKVTSHRWAGVTLRWVYWTCSCPTIPFFRLGRYVTSANYSNTEVKKQVNFKCTLCLQKKVFTTAVWKDRISKANIQVPGLWLRVFTYVLEQVIWFLWFRSLFLTSSFVFFVLSDKEYLSSCVCTVLIIQDSQSLNRLMRCKL